MTKRLVLATALAALLAAPLLAADLPPGKWWRRPEIINTLGLTDDQQNRLESIFRGAANDLIDAKAEVDKQNIALRGELDQPQLDRNAIRAVARKLNDARGRLFEREVTMLVDMRAVLTDAQWNRMRNELQRMGNEGGQQQQQQRPNNFRPNQRPNQRRP
jgi:Spy/CpxP family protein refolding chaperone